MYCHLVYFRLRGVLAASNMLFTSNLKNYILGNMFRTTFFKN